MIATMYRLHNLKNVSVLIYDRLKRSDYKGSLENFNFLLLFSDWKYVIIPYLSH